MITDAGGRVVYVNPRFSAITGYGRTEVLGRDWHFLETAASDVTQHQARLSALRSGQEWRGTVCHERADGGAFHAAVATAPVRDGEGVVSHYVSVYAELDEARADAVATVSPPPAMASSPFHELIESAAHGVLIVTDTAPVYANRAAGTVFGYQRAEELLALASVDELFAADERDRLRRYRRARNGGLFAPKAFECRGVKKDGTIIWLEVRVRPVMWFGVASTYWTISDITSRRIHEDRLQHQANFDLVTDLPNRSLALDRLTAAIATSRRRFRKVGVLFIDIDGFKQVNDTFGHASGDRFLRHLGERIKLCVREEDTVARLGGDEFTAVLPDLRSSADAEGVARKIIDSVSAPFKMDGEEVFVGASIGITIAPEDGTDPETLLRNADAAMYQAKTAGRNTLKFFTPELNARAVNRHRAEARLRQALNRKELLVLYQPIVDLGSGAVIGAEALLRWNDPEVGLVDAEHFVHVAEDTGLIVPIGSWIIGEACRAASRWRHAAEGSFFVSVNVSGREFRSTALSDAVAKGLREHGLPPERLHLEFSESLLMVEVPQIVNSVRSLVSAGVRLTVDDFGSGVSSLNSLGRYPLNTVKIESSLTRRMTASAVQASLVEAIIAVAHRLGLRVVAEGVETPTERAFLHGRGCDAAQGYAFSRPLTIDALTQLLQTPLATAPEPAELTD